MLGVGCAPMYVVRAEAEDVGGGECGGTGSAGSYPFHFLSNGEDVLRTQGPVNLPVANETEMLWLNPRGRCDGVRRRDLWR